jgi:hypothetical protein
MSLRYLQVLRSVRYPRALYMWMNRTFAELDATEMIFANGYSLNDAMSALEV